MRFYVSNASYPEMRNIESRWERHVTWWKAFLSSARDVRIWGFVVVGVLCAVAAWMPWEFAIRYARSQGGSPAAIELMMAGGAISAFVGWSVVALTLGGDLMRPHLRKVNPRCRDACPECGYHLRSQLEDSQATVVPCPECGQSWIRQAFEAPFQIAHAHAHTHAHGARN